jgi:hypothetical protein
LPPSHTKKVPRHLSFSQHKPGEKSSIGEPFGAGSCQATFSLVWRKLPLVYHFWLAVGDICARFSPAECKNYRLARFVRC